jgi:hypothetical protein
VAIGGDTGCAIRTSDRTVACWGADLGEPTQRPAAAVAIGDTIAAAVLSDGSVESWGETRYWPAWGYGVAPDASDFGVFRFIPRPVIEVRAGEPVDTPIRTTPVSPVPTFRVVAGHLPAGLELTSDGRITETPEADGQPGSVVIEADNDIAAPVTTRVEIVVTPAA